MDEYEFHLKALGIKIRLLRRAAKLTQTELGDLCDVSTSCICHVEKGDYMASTKRLYLIAAALGVTYSELVSTEHNPETCPYCNGTGVMTDEKDES